jgi:hypothetical protein
MGVYAFAMVSGFDHERFYPTVLVVVGHCYILFAAMGSSTLVLAQESLAAAVFLVLAPLFIGCATLGCLFWLNRAVQTRRQIGLGLKVPPVALAVMAAALMWCARSVTPDFDFPFPSNLMFPRAPGSPWRTDVSRRPLSRSGGRRPQ